MGALFLFVLACGGESEPDPAPSGVTAPPPEVRPPDVVLFTLCSVRSDHVGAYGYARDTTPAIDALAAESAVFEMAFSPGTHTNASHASLFTGLVPGHAGTLDVGEPLGADVVTLPEVLGHYGYRSAGFVDIESHFGEAAMHGMARGFGEYRYLPLTDLPASVGEWVGRSGAPTLTWVHIRRAHVPYGSGAPFTPSTDPRLAAWFAARGRPATPQEREATDAALGAALAAHPDLRANLTDLYDSGVRESDAELGRVLAEVRAKAPRAVVIVLSDHGDALGERGHFGHQDVLQPEVLHVPLVVHVPGRAPVRVRDTVDLTDVFPTIMELVGGVVPAGIDGRSLVSALAGRPLPSHPVLAQTVLPGGKPGTVRLAEALVAPPYWLSVDGDHTTLEQFDPTNGLVPVAEPDPAVLAELTATRAARSEGTRLSTNRPALSPETRQALQRQGYW